MPSPKKSHKISVAKTFLKYDEEVIGRKKQQLHFNHILNVCLGWPHVTHCGFWPHVTYKHQ